MPIIVEYNMDFGWIVCENNNGEYEIIIQPFTLNFKEALELAKSEAKKQNTTVKVYKKSGIRAIQKGMCMVTLLNEGVLKKPYYGSHYM